MTIYSVNYDLRAPGRNYDSLYGAIDSYSNCHMLESYWLIDTSKSASEIRDRLQRHIDTTDQLIVTELKKHWAAAQNCQCTAWLKSSVRNW